MIKKFKCLVCEKEGNLNFPDEFEGRSLDEAHRISSYASFRRMKGDFSHGFIGVVDGENTWICPECVKITPLYAGVNVK